MIELSSQEDTALPVVVQDVNSGSSVPQSLEGQHLSIVGSCHERCVGAGIRRFDISTPEQQENCNINNT